MTNKRSKAMLANANRKFLELQMMYATKRIPKGILNTKSHIITPYLDGCVEELVASFMGYVLTEDAGQTATDYAVISKVVEVPNFPRWLPKRLQSRWTRTATITKEVKMSVTPKWTYPHANIATLGDPVGKFGYTKFSYIEGSNDITRD
jgi:hypothetical protein